MMPRPAGRGRRHGDIDNGDAAASARPFGLFGSQPAPTLTVSGALHRADAHPGCGPLDPLGLPWSANRDLAHGFNGWKVSSPRIEKVTMSLASRFIFVRSTTRIALSS